MADPVPAEPLPADESFAQPWVSVAGEAVPLSAVELASVDYEPLPPTRGATTRMLPTIPTRSSTVSSWMLALSPVIALGLLLGAIFAAPLVAPAATANPDGAPSLIVGTGSLLPVSTAQQLANPTVSALILGALAFGTLLVIVAAITDRIALGRLGFTDRASAAWVIIGPLPYLIARTVATANSGRRGSAPLWTHLGVVIAVVALGVAAPFVAPREASVADMRAVESAIATELAAEGVADRVICPDGADARIGSGFMCDALDADGAIVALVSVQWTGIDGSIAYSVELAAPAALD